MFMDVDCDRLGEREALHARLVNSVDAMPMLMTRVERRLGRLTTNTSRAYQVQVCIAEALNNVVRHSGQRPGTRHIFLGLYPQRQSIRIEIRDSGKAYDPPRNAMHKSDDENGRGWMILRQWTDRIRYRRHGRINRLSLTFEL